MSMPWYFRRLAAMDVREVARRGGERARLEYWRQRYFSTGRQPRAVGASHCFESGLPRTNASDAPSAARSRLLSFADAILLGEWPTFSVLRRDVVPEVDWFLDPRHRTRAPATSYAFDTGTGRSGKLLDIKYAWELSRHHQTTVLAMAFWLTGDERYAKAAVAQIESWIHANPFLTGIHWSSGIEIGMRLIAFSWVRRLLTDWPPVRSQFDENEKFRQCVFLHQWLLAHRSSYGSSANNHLLYEMAGLYISSCSMPWHSRSAAWREHAKHVLDSEFSRQIFPSGYSREVASDYNGFVLEGLVLCLVEGELTGHPVGTGLWDCARRMFLCLERISDCLEHPPRQGDSDDASALLLDAPDYDRWRDLAELSRGWFSGGNHGPDSLRAWLFQSLVHGKRVGTFAQKPVWSDAGLVILRSRRGREIFCVFDSGPLGYLSLAAHGHADTLSVEIRYGGQPVLVDPGTYAYWGPWREYFRSTRAHNTIELGGLNQSASGGPFLWSRHARANLLCAEGLEENADGARAAGEHDGYLRAKFRGSHRREVSLDRRSATIVISDHLKTHRKTPCRMFFHLHPDIGCSLSGAAAELDCAGAQIRMALPANFAWRAIRGCDAPVLGWYSPSYDLKLPTTTLIGETVIDGALNLESVVTFPD